MRQQIKSRWVDALRSNEYPQTFGMLRRTKPKGDNTPEGYCCLGVLCELAVQDGVIAGIENEGFGVVEYGQESRSIALLPIEVADWAEVSTDPLVEFDGEKVALSSLNDDGKTFEEIANLVEEQL